jgi:hypothetical protein
MPTEDQKEVMEVARKATKQYADTIDLLLSDGADKTYILRKIRECGMWANAAITRSADGTPRE